MYRIGILGGSFNPIHYGHLIIANNCINTFKLDRVFFIPAMNPLKESILPLHRYNMTKIATYDNSLFEVLDIEIKQEKPCYTIDTINYLKNDYKNAEFFFITGTDIIFSYEKWKDYDKLGNMIDFIVYKRSLNVTEEDKKRFLRLVKNVFFVDSPVIEISSSVIRDYIKKGYSIKYLLPDTVIDYIKENRLYL